MIYNNRNKDYAYFSSHSWSGILVGTDGYPTYECDCYYIAGSDKDGRFEATAIEFYGVKTQTWLFLLIAVIIIKSQTLVWKIFESSSFDFIKLLTLLKIIKLFLVN